MAAAIKDFGPYKRGDTVDAITFTVLVDGSPPASPIQSVAIDLRKGKTRYYRYDSADGAITIDSDNQFTIVARRLDVEAKIYCYDCQITFADGSVKTYLEGTWTVVEDVTKDS